MNFCVVFPFSKYPLEKQNRMDCRYVLTCLFDTFDRDFFLWMFCYILQLDEGDAQMGKGAWGKWKWGRFRISFNFCPNLAPSVKWHSEPTPGSFGLFRCPLWIMCGNVWKCPGPDWLKKVYKRPGVVALLCRHPLPSWRTTKCLLYCVLLIIVGFCLNCEKTLNGLFLSPQA